MTLGGLSTILVEEYEKWMPIGYHLIPGKKLCKTCRKEINKRKQAIEEESSEEDEDMDFVNGSFNIDQSMVELGISPIKKHSTSKNHLRSEMKRFEE